MIVYPPVGEVTLSKTRRSTRITLSVGPNGSVRLSYPVWVTQKRALKFLDEKRGWIEAGRQKMADKYPDLARTGNKNQKNEEEKAAERRAVETLRARAKARLPEMVERLAKEHGFSHGAVRIKVTKSRWGSCTVRNDINLSLSLAALPEHLAEYIVLHELCHTVHKNHSQRFYALLDRVTEGRHRKLNKELKAYRPDTARSLPY